MSTIGVVSSTYALLDPAVDTLLVLRLVLGDRLINKSHGLGSDEGLPQSDSLAIPCV